MTQPPRTTETINRDNGAIREIMHDIRELTVPDRATLAVGLVGHLATIMNRSQMTKLLGELQMEAEKVQDVPPARRAENSERNEDASSPRSSTAVEETTRREYQADSGARSVDGHVGQAGRGAFRSGELL